MIFTNGDFDFFFKIPQIFKFKLDFFPIKKVFRKTAKLTKLTYFELIMTEVSENFKNIFVSPKPAILQVEVGFFSDRKSFSLNGWILQINLFQTNYERSFSEFEEHFLVPKTPYFDT